MPLLRNWFFMVLATTMPGALRAQTGAAICPLRPTGGTLVTNPVDVYSQRGVLNAALTLRSEPLLYLEECFIYQGENGPVEAPTLRVRAGDQVLVSLTNHLSYVPPPQFQRPIKSRPSAATARMRMRTREIAGDPCSGGNMLATSTNIHFHGINIPPLCHQDDVLNTVIENSDPLFQFNFRIPVNEAPGMYWYHPHLHGFSTLQVNGGASGVLIVDGMESVKPQVSGLPERIFVIRQQFSDPNSWLAGPYQLTVNFQPAVSPNFPLIRMRPCSKEFWRVANASSQAFLALQFQVNGVSQSMELIALDGIPVKQSSQPSEIDLPPGGRAEFIVQAPAEGKTAALVQTGYDTGPIGNLNSAQKLAVVNVGPDTISDGQPPPVMPTTQVVDTTLFWTRFSGAANLKPFTTRSLYFSEATNGTNGPTRYFVTVQGETPRAFDVSAPPAVETKVGAIEDWTIENRTGEVHTFHIHQIHFLLLATNGEPEANPELRDTVIVPAWTGTGQYPSATLRMDFRDPDIAGTFVYHCHILDHEDAGMMAKIQVDPN
jgi:FtsP/CotA-like multicopper oxidase with cupredoxin domain